MLTVIAVIIIAVIISAGTTLMVIMLAAMAWSAIAHDSSDGILHHWGVNIF